MKKGMGKIHIFEFPYTQPQLSIQSTNDDVRKTGVDDEWTQSQMHVTPDNFSTIILCNSFFLFILLFILYFYVFKSNWVIVVVVLNHKSYLSSGIFFFSNFFHFYFKLLNYYYNILLTICLILSTFRNNVNIYF